MWSDAEREEGMWSAAEWEEGMWSDAEREDGMWSDAEREDGMWSDAERATDILKWSRRPLLSFFPSSSLFFLTQQLVSSRKSCCVWRMGKMGAPWGWYGVEECI